MCEYRFSVCLMMGQPQCLEFFLVGCRGGSRYFVGGCGFLGIQKIQKTDSLKMLRFHADPRLFKMVHTFSKICSNHWEFPKRILEHSIKRVWKWRMCWGEIPNMRNAKLLFCCGSGGPRFGKFWDFRKVKIWKDNMFLRCSHDFSCIAWPFWYNKNE